MAFAAILFDLDGTLVDSRARDRRGDGARAARGQGIAIEQYDRDFIIGRSWVAIYDSLAARYPQLTWTARRARSRATAMLRDEVFAELGITVLPGARDVLGWTRRAARAGHRQLARRGARRSCR